MPFSPSSGATEEFIFFGPLERGQKPSIGRRTLAWSKEKNINSSTFCFSLIPMIENMPHFSAAYTFGEVVCFLSPTVDDVYSHKIFGEPKKAEGAAA